MMQAPVAVERDIPLNLYRHPEPLLAVVEESRRLTPAASSTEVRHVVLRYPPGSFRFLEGQAVGIPPPGLNAHGRPNVPRLYSIASAREGEDGSGTSLALTVKRVVYMDESGQDRLGLSSNFLCEAGVGEVVRMTGPAGKELLLPEDPRHNLVLIATGTGIAPFRGFLHHRYRTPGARCGQTHLFFGARSADDILYRDEWQRFSAEPGFEAHFALSREQSTPDGRRMYVQDRLREAGRALWRLVARADTSIYVCGIKGMEVGVQEAFAEIAAAEGLDWQEFRAGLVHDKRWHVEVY